MSVPLDLRIRCNLPDAQQFVIFVNPKQNIDQGHLFTDLFPVAWKVARFSPVDRDGNGDVVLSFSVERSAGISTLVNNNEVVASWTSAVTGTTNWFKTQDNEGAFKLVPNDTPTTDKSAKVSNVLTTTKSIFFGDKDGAPFMFQNVNSRETVEFQEKTKIVIVAVRGYKENDVIKSDITGPWLEFQVANTQGATRGNKFYIEYKNDFTYALYSNNGVPFNQFDSNIPVFTGSKAKGSATLDDVKAMQVEV
ncbi:hypothetical protein BGZ75_010239 [Mortierella antarctica]|nr:hypothetical protein BGZ67_009610 [Mortierella alpina]KAF9977737.1 hypothetical protein BGZ75_010239 [Mortierella antarctica]